MKSLKPNHFGKKILVESCQKITVKHFLSSWKNKFKKHMLRSNLVFQNMSICLDSTQTYFGGERLWFLCPLCQKRKGVLFEHPLNLNIGCRECLNLDYQKKMKKGMLEETIIKEME